MPIISSQIIYQMPQVDGRTSVRERHTDHNGETYDIEYLAAIGLDIQAVLTARAENLGIGIDQREAVLLEANNFEIPITKFQYLSRFTTAEYNAIMELAKTDPDTAFIVKKLDSSGAVYLGSTPVQNGLAYLVFKGVLTAERAAIIGAV